MHHGGVPLGIIMNELLLAQPVDQVCAIRCVEDRLQGIGFAHTLDVMRHRQQMQVVIAQHGDRRGLEIAHEAQRFQRLRATVDQITGQPQAVARGAEVDALQQALQGLQATLQVTNGIGRQCNAPGTARRNAAMTASKLCPSSASIR